MQRKGEISEYTDSEEVDYGGFEIGDAWTQKEALHSEAKLGIFKTTKRELFPIQGDSDNTFVDFLSTMVNLAKEIVCLSSYMIQKCDLTNALLDAASRGVRVYMLTSGEEELARVDTEMDDIEKAKIEGYRQLLNSMAGRVLIRTAPHFHAKFLLVDPHAQHGQGVMMTCNATLDAMTGTNLEAAITLTQAEVASFFSQFVRAFWQEAQHELLRAGVLSDIHQTPNSVAFGQVIHPATFARCATLKEQIQQLIDSAEKTIVATGWSFGVNHPILASLVKALDRSVAVKIFTRPSFWNTEALIALATKGAKVKGHDRYHAKMIIVDSNRSLLMTSNLTERGLDVGFETAIELRGEETNALVTIVNHWESLCQWELCPKLQLKDASRLVRRNTMTTKKLDVIEVNDALVKDLGTHSPVSLDEPPFRLTLESANPNKQSASRIYKRVTYTWRVSPPILPTRASPVQSVKDPFPLYKIPNGENFITVSRWEDVEKAKLFAKKWKAKIVLQKKKAEILPNRIEKVHTI